MSEPAGVTTKGRTIRTHLAFVLALALAPPAVFGMLQAYSNYREDRAGAERQLIQAGLIAAGNHEEILTGARQVLTTIAGLEPVERAVRPACDKALKDTLFRQPEYKSVLALNAKGEVVCASEPVPPTTTFADRPWFRQVTTTRTFTLSELLVSRLSSDVTLIAAVPMVDPSRETGALALSIDLSALVVLARRGLPEDAFIVLVDSAGKWVVLSGSAPALDDILFAGLTWTDTGKAQASVKDVHSGGRDYALAFAPLLDTDLSIAIGQPAENVFAWAATKLARNLAAPVLLWLMAVATAWFAADRILVRWLLELETFARAVAAGESSTAGASSFDAAPNELRRLRASILRMLRTIEQRGKELQRALEQRELLIKEIHHRVKNNLQIIGSLVNLQARTIRDDAGRRAVLGMRSRINALALVHRSLYETADLQQIDLEGFVEGLCEQLHELVASEDQHIELDCQVPSRLVSTDTAVTLAMLITEATANAMKHAFPERRNGTITVRLEEPEPGAAALTIADDGVGGFGGGEEAWEGLGRSLMEGFARQLGGKLTVTSDNGTVVRVDIPELA